jgi:LPXTG-motif cell wall-anchored protein
LPFTGSSTLPPFVGLMSLGAGGALWFMGRRRVARRA